MILFDGLWLTASRSQNCTMNDDTTAAMGGWNGGGCVYIATGNRLSQAVTNFRFEMWYPKSFESISHRCVYD